MPSHEDQSVAAMKINRPGKRCALLACILTLASPVAVASGLTEASEQAWRLHPQAAALDGRSAAAQAAQSLAGALTPEPATVSFGSLNDRQGRNLGKQEWAIDTQLCHTGTSFSW